MEVQDKYLPNDEFKKEFIQNRISEYKKQIYGGVLEIKMAEANGEKRNATVTEDMIKQIINNMDIMFDELDLLG